MLAVSNPTTASSMGCPTLPSTVQGTPITLVLTPLARKYSESTRASVRVCEAPTKTSPSNPSVSQVT